MRFYLNNLSNRVYVEVAPQITETFDESLDSATVVLQANTISTPYAPNQYFYICDDNNNILYTMVLALDMVETFSSKPLRYRHTLTLTQNSRNLSKHIVRNSVFTQPMNEYKRGFFATKNILQKHEGGLTTYSWLGFAVNYWNEPIKITSKDRVKGDFVIEPQVIGFYYNDQDNVYNPNGDDKPHIFKANMTDFSDGTDIVIKLYKDGNDTGQSIVLTSDMLGSKIVVDNFTNYIKNHPLGEYSLYINSDNLFCTKSVTASTIRNHTPTQFALSINFSIQIYYYNCYDLLELLIERQQLKNFRYARQKLFTLPTNGELYDLLIGTIPPNFTFTASTMYECVADIFKLFDAIFTLDNNNVLGIEYLNEYGDENTSDVSSSRSSHAEENYNRGIVNFYQDARVLERFPSGKGYAKARSAGLGIPTSTNDFCILLPHKIEYVDKVEMLNPKIKIQIVYFKRSGDTASAADYAVYDDDIIIDISSFVYESSMWGLLSSGDLSTITSNQEKIQANTTYYQKGDNKIMLGLTYQNGAIQTTNFNFSNIIEFAWLRLGGEHNITGVSNISYVEDSISSNFTLIKTAITYMASVNGKLEIESINPKYNGEIFVDQSNGAVDLNKLGLNMFGLAQKLGEPTLTKTMQIVDFSDRIRKGQYIIQDGEKWIANVITHTILNDGKVQSVVNFVKNYNALSLFTRVNKEKRMSTISSDLINKSEILFGEYLYFSSSNLPYNYQSPTKMDMSQICSLFYSTFKLDESDTHRIDYAIINSYDKSDNLYTFNDDGTERNVENIAIPLVRYGSGNSICLEASFSHPKSAGNKTITKSATVWWGSISYYTNFVPYTDENGFIDKIDYKLYYKVAESDLDNYPIIDTVSNDTLIIDLSKLVVDKFSNEILAINYQIHMLPMNERKNTDFVGSAFINNNALVKNPQAKNFYIHISNNYFYSILDTKGQGNRYLVTDVSYHASNNAFELTFEYSQIDNSDIVSWAICDEDGNIYFASNTQPCEEETTLYFACRNQRVEDYDLENYYVLKFTVGNNVTITGNIGSNFVSYSSGTNVEISLEEGTQYSLHTEYADHWYSDENGWDNVSGTITNDTNLGTSSSGLKESQLTIEWNKNVIAIKVGDTTYYNPDPSDDFLYTTILWERQGQEIDYQVTQVTEGYYVRNDSGTWRTNDPSLTISPTADAYRKIVINWKKGIEYVRIGTINQGYEDFYNPNPSGNYGEQVVRSNIVQYSSNTQFTCYAISGYQITSGESGWSDWSSGDLYINPTVLLITYTLTITTDSHIRSVNGSIARGGSNIESFSLGTSDTYSYDECEENDTVSYVAIPTDSNSYYIPNATVTDLPIVSDLTINIKSYYIVGELALNTTQSSAPTATQARKGKYYVSTSGYYYRCVTANPTEGNLYSTTKYSSASALPTLSSSYIGYFASVLKPADDTVYIDLVSLTSSSITYKIGGNNYDETVASATLIITYSVTEHYEQLDSSSFYVYPNDPVSNTKTVTFSTTIPSGFDITYSTSRCSISNFTYSQSGSNSVLVSYDLASVTGTRGTVYINLKRRIPSQTGLTKYVSISGSKNNGNQTYYMSSYETRTGTSAINEQIVSTPSRYYLYEYQSVNNWQPIGLMSNYTSANTFYLSSDDENYYWDGSDWVNAYTYTWSSGTSAEGCAFTYNNVLYYYDNGALH